MRDLETVVSDDRRVFAEIAQAIFSSNMDTATQLLSNIKKQCEDRIVAIGKALKDV